MADQFTHNFKFEVNGAFIRGECEFNSDKKASFKMTSFSEPIPLSILEDFSHFFVKLKEMHDDYVNVDGTIVIKKIIIKEKEVK